VTPIQPDLGDSPNALESLILDLLEWIGPSGRPYDEVLDAWRTSCPRLPVFEDANERGFVERKRHPSHRTSIRVSVGGVEHLRTLRPRTATQNAASEG
jgi:hypothetical protein